MPGKQSLCQFKSNYTGCRLAVFLRFIKELPGYDFGLSKIRIIGIGPNQLAVHFAATMLHILALAKNGQHPLHPGHSILNARRIRILQTVDCLPLHTPTLKLGLVRQRLDAADDHILRAQALDSLLRVLTGAFTNGHQRYDRPHANDHAQHGEATPQLM